MERSNYTKKILEKYKNNFDLQENFKIGETLFSNYGYFTSKSEKYVFLKDINLWEVNNSEHVFFINTDNLSREKIKINRDVIKNIIEPKLVRRGEKYPPKNHMYTYITFVFISSREIIRETVKEIQKFKEEKNYLFSFRGYMCTRVVAVDLKNKKVYTNGAGKELKNIYMKNFN